MSGYFERKAYEQGLNGEKPSIILGRELYDAQMEGYKQYLSNQNLADSIADNEREAEEREERRSSRYRNVYAHDYDYSSSPSPSKPLTLTQRILGRSVGVFLIWLDYQLLVCLSTECGRIPWRWSAKGNDIFFIIAPLLIFVVFPGGLLFWPGILLVFIKNREKEQAGTKK